MRSIRPRNPLVSHHKIMLLGCVTFNERYLLKLETFIYYELHASGNAMQCNAPAPSPTLQSAGSVSSQQGSKALCSSGKFNPKRRAPQFLFFKSFYVTELEKKKKFRKNPMRENIGTNCLVCDAMLKVAKNHLTQKSTETD